MSNTIWLDFHKNLMLIKQKEQETLEMFFDFFFLHGENQHFFTQKIPIFFIKCRVSHHLTQTTFLKIPNCF